MKIVVLLLVAMILSTQGQVNRIRVMVLGDQNANQLLFNPAPEDLAPRFLQVEIQPGILAKLPVQMGAPSTQIAINGGLLEVPIFRGIKPNEDAWTKVTLPKAGDYLAVIVQSPRRNKMGWRRVKTYVFEDEKGIAPKGKIRVLNASEKSLALKLGDLQAKALKAGKSMSVPQPEKETELKMAQKTEAGKYRMIRGCLLEKRKKGVRKSYFVYQDGNLSVKSLLHVEEVNLPKN